jgi:hypothetical protein
MLIFDPAPAARRRSIDQPNAVQRQRLDFTLGQVVDINLVTNPVDAGAVFLPAILMS